MKLASLPDEACFVGHRSLYHFFPYIFRKKILTSNLRDEY